MNIILSWVCAAAVVFSGTFPAHAAPDPSVSLSPIAAVDPYTVPDVVVDVTADDAVKAREQAFEQALTKSFAMLALRIVDAERRNRLPMPEATEISKLLKDFSVKNEQMGRARYTATYDMRYDARKVLDFLVLAEQAAPKSNDDLWADTSKTGAPAPVLTDPALPTLILPWFANPVTPVLWSDKNKLLAALAKVDINATPYKIPLGDLEDMQIFNDRRGLGYDPDELQKLMDRYGAHQVVFVTDALLASGGLRVDLVVPSHAPVRVGDLNVDQAEVAGEGDVYARAARQIIETLPKTLSDFQARSGTLQMPKTALASGTPEQELVIEEPPMVKQVKGIDSSTDPSIYTGPKALQMVARFRDLNEWQDMRGRLSSVPDIKSLRVLSLKTREARVEMLIEAEEEKAFAALRQKGLQVTAPHLDLGGEARMAGNAIVYSLALDPWGSARRMP